MKFLRRLFCRHTVFFDDLKRINPDRVEARCSRCDKLLRARYGLALNCRFIGWRKPSP